MLLTAQTGDELIATAERAIELFTAIGEPIELAKCWLRLADGLESTGQPARARAARNCARALFIESGIEPDPEFTRAVGHD